MLTCTPLTSGGSAVNQPSYETAAVACLAGDLIEIDLWSSSENPAQPYDASGITGLGCTFEKEVAVVPGVTDYYAMSRWRAEAPANASGVLTINWPVTMDATVWSVKVWRGQVAGNNGADAYLQSATAIDSGEAVLGPFAAPANRLSIAFGAEGPLAAPPIGTLSAGLTSTGQAIADTTDFGGYQEMIATASGGAGVEGGTFTWADVWDANYPTTIASEIAAAPTPPATKNSNMFMATAGR